MNTTMAFGSATVAAARAAVWAVAHRTRRAPRRSRRSGRPITAVVREIPWCVRSAPVPIGEPDFITAPPVRPYAQNQLATRVINLTGFAQAPTMPLPVWAEE